MTLSTVAEQPQHTRGQLSTQPRAHQSLVVSNLPIHRFSLDEYHRLIKSGFFDNQEEHDKRVELIEGVLVRMSPMDPKQAFSIRVLSRLFIAALGMRASVSTQLPITLPAAQTEPEPDLCLVKPEPSEYQDRHPHPEDILLIVEVAYTSVVYDSSVKLALYAREGLGEYWIVNVADGLIEVHREPRISEDGVATYQSKTTHRSGEIIAPGAFPDCKIRVDDILPQRAEES